MLSNQWKCFSVCSTLMTSCVFFLSCIGTVRVMNGEAADIFTKTPKTVGFLHFSAFFKTVFYFRCTCADEFCVCLVNCKDYVTWDGGHAPISLMPSAVQQEGKSHILYFHQENEREEKFKIMKRRPREAFTSVEVKGNLRGEVAPVVFLKSVWPDRPAEPQADIFSRGVTATATQTWQKHAALHTHSPGSGAVSHPPSSVSQSSPSPTLDREDMPFSVKSTQWVNHPQVMCFAFIACALGL